MSFDKGAKKDIIIIGGGVVGASCAYFLSKYESCNITLVEKTDIACAASGKSGGFLALDWSSGIEGMDELSRASFKLHQQLSKDFDGVQRYGYRAMSTYSCTFDADKTKHLKSLEGLDWINKDAISSLDQIGTTETTAQVTPALLTKTLVEEAEATGRLKVLLGNGVKRLLYDGNDETVVIGVELEDGEQIRGDQVVVCMGPWSGQLPFADKSRIRIKAAHVHSIVLKPAIDAQVIPNHALFTTIVSSRKSEPSEPEVYPRADGTVYMCGAQDSEPLPESATLVKVDDRAIQDLVEQASMVSSILTVSEKNGAKLIKRQACYLPISEKTSMPLIGPHPGYKGLYLATGHSFWGILNAPITGKIISELLVEGHVKCISPKGLNYFTP